MLRALVVSDSHHYTPNLEAVAARFKTENCDRIFHLGDVVEDARQLEKLTGVPVEFVAGNCDFLSSDPRTRLELLEDTLCLICHGDQYGVKITLYNLAEAASGMGAGFALFGHTHKPYCGFVDGVLLVNPGALKDGKYAVIEFERGDIRPKLKELY